MEKADVIIIGGGLLGCFSARALAGFELKTIVLEAREDVCTGISRANTGIVYTGGDTAPGTMKTKMCVAANRRFGDLCRQLDVAFSRPGSLMVAFGERGCGVLEKKLALGRENGVEGQRLLSGAEALELEPGLAPNVKSALFSPGTGTVNPWELGIAAFENARDNGVEFRFREEVKGISRSGGGFVLDTEKGQYFCRSVINCAGLFAAAVREFVAIPAVRVFPDAGDYLVLDTTAFPFLRHVIFHEPEIKGKGLTLVPTVEGNVLVGPTEREGGDESFSTSLEGLEQLRRLCAEVFPALPLDSLIRSFGALRPNPYHVSLRGGVWVPESRSISNFTVLEDDGFFSLVGIKTPGLTCAAELGRHAAGLAADFLGCDRLNPRFDQIRRGIVRPTDMDASSRAELIARDGAYGRIVCRCRGISEGQVRDAISRGAVTVDGVKRRVGAGMGRCQGAFCMQRVMERIAADMGIPAEAVCKDGDGTENIYGKI